MKKLFLYVFLGLLWCNVGFAEKMLIPSEEELNSACKELKKTKLECDDFKRMIKNLPKDLENHEKLKKKILEQYTKQPQDKILGGERADLMFKCSIPEGTKYYPDGANFYYGFNHVSFGSKKKWVQFAETVLEDSNDYFHPAQASHLLSELENGEMDSYGAYYDESDGFSYYTYIVYKPDSSSFISANSLKVDIQSLGKHLWNDKVYFAWKEYRALLGELKLYKPETLDELKKIKISNKDVNNLKKLFLNYHNELREYKKWLTDVAGQNIETGEPPTEMICKKYNR